MKKIYKEDIKKSLNHVFNQVKYTDKNLVMEIMKFVHVDWVLNNKKEYSESKPVGDLIETIGMNHKKLRWYITNTELGSDMNRKNRCRKWNTDPFSEKMWIYICNKCCETTQLKNVCPGIDDRVIQMELNKSERRNIDYTKIRWLFFSNGGPYFGLNTVHLPRWTVFMPKYGPP